MKSPRFRGPGRDARFTPQLAGLLGAVLLAGCGGSSSNNSDGTTPPPATTASRSGLVIDGPIRGATVCLDLDGDGQCGASEPASAATDASGRYEIAGLTEAQLASGAAFVAVVPAGAIDADRPDIPIATAFTLKAPAGKGEVISPITTLVQLGVAQGLTLAQAETAVAAQLGVPATSLYRNYVAEPSAEGSATLAAVASSSIVPALQSGEPLEVAPATAGANRYQVGDFAFTDPQNWSLRYLVTDGQPGPDGRLRYRDRREQWIGGVATPEADLFAEDPPVFRLTADGVIQCGPTVVNTTGSGSPYQSDYCGDSQLTRRTTESVAGQAVADVIRRIQTSGGNTLGNLDPALVGSAVMPAGATVIHRTARTIDYAVRYRPADGSLAMPITALPSNFPGPVNGTVGGLNSVSLGTQAPTTAGGENRRPRAAFGADGTAYYYLCDLVDGASTNCVEAGTGTWQARPRHGTATIEFTNLPAANNDRVFVEVDGQTYYGYRIRPQATEIPASRLDHLAFGAVATALGITAPAP